MPREQDEQIAEKLFGWKWYHGYDSGEPGNRGAYSLLMEQGAFDSWCRRFGPSEEFPGFPINKLSQGCPPYTSDAGADYLVLCHVREKWALGQQMAFNAALHDMLVDNDYDARRNKGAKLSAPLIRYEPGLYSQAALAVLNQEQSDAD